MSKKLPFKISARTARLIGRQNFPNAEGAIIELVKNCYDADANTSIIIFDNKHAVLPIALTSNEYDQFLKQEKLISKYYQFNENEKKYVLNEHNPKKDSIQEKIKTEMQQLRDFFRSQCRLFIIDNGEGMTDQIIEDFWMTIGTNNKEVDVYTKTGRIKTGEKGIGRFALDKLGDSAEMLTKPDSNVYPDIKKDISFLWSVDWNVFEGDVKTLNEVEADLIELESIDFGKEIENIFPFNTNKFPELQIATFSKGTQIEIKGLRDEWDQYSVGRLFNNLEVLIPPREERIFDVFLFSTLEPEKYGKVAPSICDDYDYKISAQVSKDGIAEINLFRNEFDISKFPDAIFQRKAMQKENFTKESFNKENIVIQRRLSELIPGLADVDNSEILKNIGAFDFVFYFLKASSSKDDREVFLSKEFNATSRRVWFKQFGGIKLFRDNFRVRPYGEIDNAAFDWLLLGERAARSPASIGQQRQGTWRVRPSQISGIIDISRLTNINFEDTSSRYGLQENQTFSYFSKVILGIIDVFEDDRTTIGKELKAFYEETHKGEVSDEKTQEIKIRIRKNVSKPIKSQSEKDSETLLQYTEKLEKQIEELMDESNLLKILASNGLITASFTHELKNIKDNLVFRIDELKNQFAPVVDMVKCNELPRFLNPFMNLEVVKREDEKLREWLHFSLETLRRDKRRRKDIDLVNYFEQYKKSWDVTLKMRGVTLNLVLPEVKELKLRAFEADLDCIFNNLLINSLEAFLRKDAPRERHITLKLELKGPNMHFQYSDTGPGLSKDILVSERIFEPHFTTKKDFHTGEDTGTGLGMWLVKSFITENNGTIELIENHPGFGVIINFFNKVNPS